MTLNYWEFWIIGVWIIEVLLYLMVLVKYMHVLTNWKLNTTEQNIYVSVIFDQDLTYLIW